MIGWRTGLDTRDGHQRLCISVYLLLDEVTVGDSRDFLIFAFSLLFSSGPLFPRLRPLFIPSYSIRKNHPRSSTVIHGASPDSIPI